MDGHDSTQDHDRTGTGRPAALGIARWFLAGKEGVLNPATRGWGCVVVVVLTHLFEALQVLPWMRWGEQHSVGHYVDLSSAILALTLFPIGYWLQALKTEPA